MNVFVLGTGRCGTVTFSRACAHLTNYTVGHETNAARYGDARFSYPDRHIEVDPRLPWFLGELGDRYPDAFYVHLVRDPEATARSIVRRWNGSRIGFARVFGESMLMQGRVDDPAERMEIARFQVRSMNANIQSFLRAHMHRAYTMHLEHAKDGFGHFLDMIHAQGDFQAAFAEWDIKYNASQGAA